MIDIAINWLQIVGAIILALGITIWYGGGNKNYAIWIGFFGAIILLAAFSLHLQKFVWESESSQLKTAPTEVEMTQLRAYVTAISAQVFDFNTEVTTKAQIAIKNTGQTPGHDVRVLASIGAGDFPLKQEFPPPTTTITNPSPLAAGQEIYMVPETKRPLTQTEMDIIRAGKGAIYVVGEIKYFDVFKRKHSSTFRFYYGGNRGTRADGGMTIDETGNDAD